ncbi:MAG: 5-hydroxyisourate hydrolase [Candidatus Azotimanducaceae bacterium]
MKDQAPITTHILDTSTGRPAAGVRLTLFGPDGQITRGVTDVDGRVKQWQDAFELQSAKYRIEFEVEPYFVEKQLASFYEDVHISFRVQDTSEHYHVPLLLSPFGYSTYRGS